MVFVISSLFLRLSHLPPDFGVLRLITIHLIFITDKQAERAAAAHNALHTMWPLQRARTEENSFRVCAWIYARDCEWKERLQCEGFARTSVVLPEPIFRKHPKQRINGLEEISFWSLLPPPFSPQQSSPSHSSLSLRWHIKRIQAREPLARQTFI